jgi:secondary thiamine-phosphate synthase enzyme
VRIRTRVVGCSAKPGIPFADGIHFRRHILVFTRHIDIESHQPQELIPISDQVREALAASGLANGLCTVFCPHTTGGLTLNSPLDPTTAQDLQEELDRLVPTRTNFHHQFDTPADAAAHVKGALVGHSVTVPVVDGQLDLGWSQGIFFCEFDGPRSRQVRVCLLGNA